MISTRPSAQNEQAMNQAANDRLVSLGGVERPGRRRARVRSECRQDRLSLDHDPRKDAQADDDEKTDRDNRSPSHGRRRTGPTRSRPGRPEPAT